MTTSLVERPAHVDPSLVVDFDIWSPPGGAEDIHAAWETLHADGVPPVVWTPHNGGHWIVTRMEPMQQIFEDYTLFSSRVLLVPKEIGEQFDMLPTTLDPPVNRPFRKVMMETFSPKAVLAYREQIVEIVKSRMDAFVDKGRCNFQKDFAEPLPIMLLVAISGLPMEDTPKLKYWSDQITRNVGEITIDQAVTYFYEYVRPIVEARRGGSGVDMISKFANADMGDRKITVEEATKTTSQVIQAGVDTVANVLAFFFINLAQREEVRRELVADPSRISAFIEEMLRRYPVVVNHREIIKDVDFAGAQLKAGEMMVMPTFLAGTDDTQNACPLDFDLDRKNRKSLTFGAGSHRCVGAPLAKLELEIAIAEWLKRIPDFTLTNANEIRYTPGIVPIPSDMILAW